MRQAGEPRHAAVLFPTLPRRRSEPLAVRPLRHSWQGKSGRRRRVGGPELGLMVRDAPKTALLTMRIEDLAANKTSSPRERKLIAGGAHQRWASRRMGCTTSAGPALR